MRKLLFVLLFFFGTTLLVSAQGKKHNHCDKHCHHHDHHHGHKKKKKKKKPKKHHHGKHCHHHHHDYTYVIVDNPKEQARADMNTIAVNIGLSNSQKNQVQQAYLNFYLSLNKFNNLDEKERKKKCEHLEQERDSNVNNILSQNQISLYASFLKNWL